LTSTEFGNLEISETQWFTLFYLGVIASGVGFFLWNVGATKVEAGTLSVMNNLKIPFGVIFAFIILGESVNYTQLLIGSIFIIIALIISENHLKPHSK